MDGIGIFGGTFDPVHYGHLRIATELAEALELNEVRMLPSAQPPHREAPQVSAVQRCEMLALALEGDARLQLDERELRRAGPSYMVDTLDELRAELGSERPLYLMLGSDAFLGLPGWYHWRELFALAHIVVAERPGWDDGAMPEELAIEAQRRRVDSPQGLAGEAGGLLFLPLSRLAIAASDIRARITAGRTIRYLTPEPVRRYIEEQGLYLNE